MDIMTLGIIIKAAKALVMCGILMTLMIKWVRSKNMNIRDFQFQFGLSVLFGLVVNVYDIIMISLKRTLILPKTAEYSSLIMLRLLFMILHLVPLFVLVVFVLYGQIPKKKTGTQPTFTIHPFFPAAFIPSSNSSQVQKNVIRLNSRLIIISWTIYIAFNLLRLLFRPLIAAHTWIWILSEFIEIFIWIFMGICVILINRFIQK